MKPQLTAMACALFAATSLSPAAWAQSPRDFVQKTIERENSEIMLGRLAEQRAESPAVRSFAHTLVAARMRARGRARALGHVLGIRPVEGPTSGAVDERNDLTGLHGRDFDSEYIDYTIDKQNDAISDSRDAAANDRGPVGQLAADALPALHAQLQTARSIQKSEDL